MSVVQHTHMYSMDCNDIRTNVWDCNDAEWDNQTAGNVWLGQVLRERRRERTGGSQDGMG